MLQDEIDQGRAVDLLVKWYAASSFRESERGDLLIFPRGRHGRAHRVPERKDWISLQRSMFYQGLFLALLINVFGSFSLARWGPGPWDLFVAGSIAAVGVAWHSRWRSNLERRFVSVDEELTDEDVRAARAGFLSGSVLFSALGVFIGVGLFVSFGVAWAIVDPSWWQGAVVAGAGMILSTIGAFRLARRQTLSAARGNG